MNYAHQLMRLWRILKEINKNNMETIKFITKILIFTDKHAPYFANLIRRIKPKIKKQFTKTFNLKLIIFTILYQTYSMYILFIIKGFFLGGLFITSIIFIILYQFLQIDKVKLAMDKKKSLDIIFNAAVCLVLFIIILGALKGRDLIPPSGF